MPSGLSLPLPLPMAMPLVLGGFGYPPYWKDGTRTCMREARGRSWANPEARRRPSQRREDEPHTSGLSEVICDILDMLQVYSQTIDRGLAVVA